jgi:hypothetical protein
VVVQAVAVLQMAAVVSLGPEEAEQQDRDLRVEPVTEQPVFKLRAVEEEQGLLEVTQQHLPPVLAVTAATEFLHQSMGLPQLGLAVEVVEVTMA